MTTIRYSFALQACLLLALGFPVCLAQRVSFFPLEEVKPGLKGVGKTIFEGVEIEEFDVEILGVLENVRPQRNLVLSRLSGARVEKTGVFAGMSGSPVYIDGKLLGAVAFAFPFSTEPIAGITPIQETVGVFRGRPEGVAKWSAQSTFQDRLRAFSEGRAFDTSDGLPSLDVDFSTTTPGGTLQPILAPLSLSGAAPDALRRFQADFAQLGLVPVSGVASPRADYGEVPVAPGSTLAAHLVTGDVELSAAGTITHIDGDRVYAFGHPFMGLGFTSMPMSSGAVITVISRLSNSQKVTAVASAIGAISQDRDTGILGIRGRTPDMLPVSLRLKTSRNVVRELNFDLVRGRLLSPLLANFSVFNSIVSSERGLGPQTFRVETTISVKDQPKVRYARNAADPANAALVIGGLVNLLFNSGFEDVPIERVDVEVESVEELLVAELEQVWVDRKEVKPGDQVQVKMVLRKDDGETFAQDYTLPIPESLPPGPISVVVGEGLSLAGSDADRDSAQFIPETVYQLIRAINNLKKNDRLYVRLYRESPGAVIAGEGMPALPPSMLEIHASGRTSGASRPLRNVIYLEREMEATRFLLKGVKTIQLQVEG